jgi:quinol monooxygenase YgiN
VKFAQMIEFRTSRIADFDDYLDAWMTRTEGDRVPHRAVLTRDRDVDNQYTLTVEFASHDQGVENSNRPATAEFAAFLAGICDGRPAFRNLDVLREDDL